MNDGALEAVYSYLSAVRDGYVPSGDSGSSSTTGEAASFPDTGDMTIIDESEEGYMATTNKTKGEITHKNVELVRTGTKIVVPEGMAAYEVLEWAKRYYHHEEQEVAIHAEIPCSPLDGLVCFHQALFEEFGFTDMQKTKSFFGDYPPTMVNVETGPHSHVQVGYGQITIPKVDGYVETTFKVKPEPAFVIGGTVKNKNKPTIDRIIDRTKEFLRTRSIYKGQSIKVDYSWQRRDERYDPFVHAPKFWDVRGDETDVLVFSDRVQHALEDELWAFIQFSDAFRRQRIPLRRGVLLSGPYGVGKTLSAKATARICMNNGWTFVKLDDVRDLSQALKIAAQYSPAVVFAEDVDQVVQGDRTTALNEILNTLDGVDTKDREILTVLTTNRLDTIHPSVLRPGRIDSLIELEAPNAEAAIRLVRQYGGTMIANSEPMESVGEALEGKIPAVIREVVEMSKASAIARIMRSGGDPSDINLVGGQVTSIDLLRSAEAKEMHNALINRPRPEEPTPADRMAKAMAEVIFSGQAGAIEMVAARAVQAEAADDINHRSTLAVDAQRIAKAASNSKG